jgi:hypothetical protein
MYDKIKIYIHIYIDMVICINIDMFINISIHKYTGNIEFRIFFSNTAMANELCMTIIHIYINLFLLS